MNKIIISLLFSSIVSHGFSQDYGYGTSSEWGVKSNQNVKIPFEELPKLLPYEDLNNSLFVSQIIELPNNSQKDIAQIFKNWASTSFVNLKEITVSETDNQIVLNYITPTVDYFKVLGSKNPYEISWYVRLVAQFKDGKMRLLVYEDGNSFKPGQYSRYGNVSSTPRGTIKLTSFTTPPRTDKEFHSNDFLFYRLHLQWQKTIKSLVSLTTTQIKTLSQQQFTDVW